MLPVFAFLYIGTLVDVVGRKKMMFVFQAMTLISAVLAVLNAVFLLWPKELTLLNPVPLAAIGGLETWLLCLFAFVSDISTPEMRPTRLAMIQLSHMAGSPLAPIIGAAIFDWGNRTFQNG